MAKSKLPRSTPAARGPAVPPPKLAAAAQQQYPPQSPTPAPMQQQPKAPIAGASTPPRSASPVSNHDVDSAALASAKKKKKKSKSKAKDSDFIDDHEYDLQSAAALGQRPRSPASLAARAQAQAQLLAAASELYRRIEGDAQGIPDDDAYWTSLPAHLRTFIRNALPLGQFPPAAQAALNENVNDPANRHASTQAMIAVAQQLAQAAHASQRHLQQYPPGTHPYPPLPFDASIFADLALHPDQALPLHPHPNAANNVHQGSNGTYGQYASSPNPPPTQPPVEPLPPPVVLYDNFDDEIDRYDDDGEDGARYYDDGELDDDDEILDAQGGLLRARERVWMQGGHDHAHGPNGLGAHPDALRSASKNKKKKKKKKGGAIAEAGHGDDQAHEIEVEVPPPPKPVPNHPPPSTNVSSVTRNSNAPAPSSRAAGKQPMTFNSSGKTSARPANGVAPSSNSGKRSVSSSTHGQQPAANVSSNNAKIWSTSSAEERERIKGFWLGLSMKDRQKLVQVEKETVLKKMKEQQKFLCSCAVCGRKRSAIEEELEVLYDSYYDELEEYANHQQRWASSGGTIPPPPGPGPFPGSVALDASGAVIGGDPLSRTRAAHGGRDARHTHPHPHGRKAPLHPESSDGYDDDELDDDAEYDDEDDDAEYDDEEEEDDIELDKERARDDYAKRNPVPSARRRDTNDNNDLFGLGSSLTVKGGILTVADDMLKNDGRKFLEMMEQLAERRMHREELTNAELAASDDEEDVDGPGDVDDEDVDEDEEDEEDDILTEEQRMEEGRKMFQIFAARMFEQRVLAAYRERVAQERQLQLLRELEEEDTNEKAREARRVKESQKKKDKKKAQREAKEAEKMRKDQERAAVEAEERAKQQAQRDAELKKQEEIRQKKEAERKAREDEKAKKEEERRRRQAEERERQMEVERKRREKEDKIRLEREAQEKAKRDREEAQRKAKEEQERNKREKAEREAKAKEEQERKVEAARKEKEARAQANRESKQAAAAAASQSRGSNATPLIPPSPTAAPKAGSAKATAASTPATPARATKNGSIPGFPAVNQGQPSVRGNGSQRGAGGSRSAHSSAATNTALATNASSAVPAAASANAAGSTLPAPPQGLPPRPSTAVLTPAGSSSQSSSVSVAANAGLPRPPVNSSSGSTAASSLGFGSIGPSASASVAAPASKAPGSSISPKPTQPAFVQTQDKPSSQLGYSSPVPPVGATYGQQPGLEGLRSPTLTNGLPSSSVFGSNGGMSSNLQSPSLGGHAMGGMTSNLASLNLNATSRSAGLNMGGTLVGSNAPVPGMESSSSSAHGVPCLGSNMQSPTQTPFAPMAGSNSVDPMRSRTASFADSDPMSAFAGIRPGSSLSQRVPAYRSGAPTPIGPIGRPKAMDPIQQHVHHEDHTGAIGNGRSSSSASGSGATSPRLPEGILGSSALGGDDDIVDPKPRRVSHTIPIGGGASGSSMGGGGSFFGGMGGSGAVGSGFGVSSSSPWSSFSASNQAAPGPLSPGFNTGAAPVSIGSSLGSNSFGMNQNAGTPGLGSNPPGLASGGQSDPWARVSAGWDRARYAFEQPGANHGSSGGMGGSLHGGAQVGHSHGLGGHTNHLHHQMSPGTGSSANGAMLSPFNLGAPGSGGRNLFGAPGSTVLHPGAIGSALSPTSPSDGGRHVSGSHE
ncbi:related to Stress response protein NST1 [Melanopsichium pennsylvanicum]|uniref:Stress response protein NST1 n=1 Tax=Melanopsichium pennsylvanicum TaxID=63383 RepID=A0AAJ5C326_9BASI|nr:related to Stress response protein NST1 [Melanopsichium pennsylvanicum]